MPQPSTRPDDRVKRATDLARDVAPELTGVLLTHYRDADTLDTLRPGETDLAVVAAVNRAVADVMLEEGVEVLVQVADRAAFRRFMAGRADTAENRHAWIDRAGLLRGSAALDMLGLAGSAAAPRPVFGKAPGPVADRLLDAYGDEDSGEFDVLVQALMTAGRIDVLDLAVRKLGEREGDEAADELNWVLLVAAEGASMGPSGWAELVTVPVALSAGAVPDAEALGQGLIASGAQPPTDELRLLPGWRSPDALAGLSFAAVRRVLVDLVEGRAPRDLPPGDTDELAERGFGLLLGLRIDWAIPVWDAIAAAGEVPLPPDEDEPETREEAERAALLDQWRGAVFQDHGCVPLAVVALSDTAAEIAEFLAEAGQQTEGLEEIRTFVATARAEAAGEDVVCRPEIVGDLLELSLYTAGGRFLDSVSLPASRLPARPEQMPPILEAFVRVVQDAPGR